MSPIGNTGRLHFRYDWNALPRHAASRLESFASMVMSSRSLVLTRSVKSAGKLHDLKCRLISSDTRSPALRPDISAWTLRRLRVGGKVQIRSHQFACAHFCALTLFGSHVFDPLNRGCFGARNAPALRALCVIGTPALPGQAVGDAQTQARRGGPTAGSVNSSWTVYGGQRGQSCCSCSRPWWSPRCGPAVGNNS